MLGRRLRWDGWDFGLRRCGRLAGRRRGLRRDERHWRQRRGRRSWNLCGACRAASPAGAFGVGLQRRLEGASDPDDMQLVVGATCPACGAQGVLSLHYGPTAGEDDADVLVALPR